MTRRHYHTAVFEPVEKRGFTVTFPSLPGLITEGDTLKKARVMATGTLREYPESLGLGAIAPPVEDPLSRRPDGMCIMLGSHHFLKTSVIPAPRVTVPCHTKPLKRDTPRSILRHVGMTVEDYRSSLDPKPASSIPPDAPGASQSSRNGKNDPPYQSRMFAVLRGS